MKQHPKLKILCDLYDKSNGNIDIDLLLKVCFFNNLYDVLISLSTKQWNKYLTTVVDLRGDLKKSKKNIIEAVVKVLKENNE